MAVSSTAHRIRAQAVNKSKEAFEVDARISQAHRGLRRQFLSPGMKACLAPKIMPWSALVFPTLAQKE